MTGVYHSTPADASFSPDGKAAWESESHVDQGGNSLPTFAYQNSMPVAITGPNGAALSQIPMGIPTGLSWLSDTLNGIDIYGAGFVKAPTIFIDPNSTASVTGLGTLNSPYTTLAQIQAAVSGNMAGQVIGFKRGSKLIVTGDGGLQLTLYGTGTKPVYLVPYGDAEDLPIISGEYDLTTSFVLANNSTRVWKYAIGATYKDIWQDGVRLRRIHPTANTQSNTTSTTISSEGTAVSVLETIGAGTIAWIGSTAYIRPYNDSFSGSTFLTTGGSTAVSYAINLLYSDTANTGNIIMCGLDARYARNNVCLIKAAGTTSTPQPDNIQVVGNRFQHGGADVDPNTIGGDCLAFAGAEAVSKNITNLYVAGNYCADTMNNGIEINFTTGAILEKNQIRNVCGNFFELYAVNGTATIRYNYGNYASTLTSGLKRAYYVVGTASEGGVWLGNSSTLGAGYTNDNTNALNAGNKVIFNIFENFSSYGVRASGGTGHKVQQNTWTCDSDLIWTSAISSLGLPYMLDVITVASPNNALDGFVDWSNNICYWKASQRSNRTGNFCYLPILGQGVPTGDYNIYYSTNPAVNQGWIYNANGNQTQSFTAWKAAVAAYTLDVNSLCGVNNTGANLTANQFNFNETTYKGTAANTAGSQVLTGLGNFYYDGHPYLVSGETATIGALRGA